jgi:hypothetical protein
MLCLLVQTKSAQMSVRPTIGEKTATILPQQFQLCSALQNPPTPTPCVCVGGGGGFKLLQYVTPFKCKIRASTVPYITAAIFWSPNSGIGLNSKERYLYITKFIDEKPEDNFKAEIISME